VIFTIRAFVTFFTIIDPVGLAPVVIGLTAHPGHFTGSPGRSGIAIFAHLHV